MSLGVALLALATIVGVAAVAAVVVGASAVSRNRRRRNRVVPEVDTGAPPEWAGAHTPEARLHRRLRDAVVAARAVADPDGALIQARVEVEHSAVAVDRHLVALAALTERERAGRMPQVEAAVASVEEAAAKLADAANLGRGGALPAVEDALERARLVAEARDELDTDPMVVLDEPDDPPPTPRATPG